MAGRSLTNSKAQDFFANSKELQEVLQAAEVEASNEWEKQFISSQIEKSLDWGLGMFMSPKQFTKLILIAGRKQDDTDELAMD